mmetsp:Transcript_15476/g.28064  ORF Transcript_15476/g.28064 Transcript_15476/m.28064 type:complete len:96 (+) Transcript_15476:4322-4609(+)
MTDNLRERLRHLKLKMQEQDLNISGCSVLDTSNITDDIEHTIASPKHKFRVVKPKTRNKGVQTKPSQPPADYWKPIALGTTALSGSLLLLMILRR